MPNPFTTAQFRLFSALSEGKVVEAIVPNHRGRVIFEGSWWSARLHNIDCQATVLPGDLVIVVGIENTTLLVVPKESFKAQEAHLNKTCLPQEILGFIPLTNYIPKVVSSVDSTKVSRYRFTGSEVEEFALDFEESLPKEIGLADINQVSCYRFTTTELEEFEKDFI